MTSLNTQNELSGQHRTQKYYLDTALYSLRRAPFLRSLILQGHSHEYEDYLWDILGTLPRLCLLKLENTPSSFHGDGAPPTWPVSFTKLVQVLPYLQQLTLDWKFCLATDGRSVTRDITTPSDTCMLTMLDIQNLDIPAQSLMDIALVCLMLQELKVTLNLNIGGDQTLGLAYSLDRYQSYQHQRSRTESTCVDGHRARVHERRSKIFAEDLASACPRLHTLTLRNSLASTDVKESSEVSQLARDLISALGARLSVLSVWKQLMFNSTMDLLAAQDGRGIELAPLRELYIPGTGVLVRIRVRMRCYLIWSGLPH